MGLELTVNREQGDALCTPGEMLIEGAHFCYTLEPRRDQSQGKPFCIPADRYEVKLQWSQHFDRVVPVLQNVPNFTAVELHPGNAPKDTHACTLVGESESTDWVGQSEVAFEALMQKLQGEPEIFITYVDPKENQ